jgi:hypothetical protein
MAGPLFLPMGGHDCFTPEEEIQRQTFPMRQGNDGSIIVAMCKFGPMDYRPLPKDHIFLPDGYSLYTLILDSDDGETMFGFTHVLREARLDVQVKKFEKFVKVGDSGLEPFTQRGQRAAHVHLAIMKDSSQFGRWQGGKGNIKPWVWLFANGFRIRQVARVPSPNDYMNGYMNLEPY